MSAVPCSFSSHYTLYCQVHQFQMSQPVPHQASCLVISLHKILSFIISKTGSFITLSTHFTLSTILLYYFSNASKVYLSAFPVVQVSHPHRTWIYLSDAQNIEFKKLVLTPDTVFDKNTNFLLIKSSFIMASLLLMWFLHSPSL